MPMAMMSIVTGRLPRLPIPISGVFCSLPMARITNTSRNVPTTSQKRLRGLSMMAGIVQKTPSVAAGSSVASKWSL